MSKATNNWVPIVDVPLMERPDGPLVWVTQSGHDLCDSCAEGRDDLEFGLAFYNWQSIRLYCASCGERFVMEGDGHE